MGHFLRGTVAWRLLHGCCTGCLLAIALICIDSVFLIQFGDEGFTLLKCYCLCVGDVNLLILVRWRCN